jgi:hypothetical protein
MFFKRRAYILLKRREKEKKKQTLPPLCQASRSFASELPLVIDHHHSAPATHQCDRLGRKLFD